MSIEIITGIIAAFAPLIFCLGVAVYKIRQDPLEDVYW
jgi:hypothetical protein